MDIIARPNRRLRCAIYTRKSSEEGLDMEFNSLDAQREACEAYIVSQRSEGWVATRERYDDGGFSGGSGSGVGSGGAGGVGLGVVGVCGCGDLKGTISGMPPGKGFMKGGGGVFGVWSGLGGKISGGGAVGAAKPALLRDGLGLSQTSVVPPDRAGKSLTVLFP